MASRRSNNRPAIFGKPTMRIAAMADWTPERVELSRERETLVWEETAKTVVEVPWWLREPEPKESAKPTKITKMEPIRALRQQGIDARDARERESRGPACEIDEWDSFDDDTVPTVFLFRPFGVTDPEPESDWTCGVAFQDTLLSPLGADAGVDPFPREITNYNVDAAVLVGGTIVDSPFEDTDEVIPLQRVMSAPRLRVGRVGLLGLLILALSTLVAATVKVFNLIPRLQP